MHTERRLAKHTIRIYVEFMGLGVLRGRHHIKLEARVKNTSVASVERHVNVVYYYYHWSSVVWNRRCAREDGVSKEDLGHLQLLYHVSV